MKNISNGLRLSRGIWIMMRYVINIRNSVLCLVKVFLIFLVSVCFVLIGVGSWTNLAHASNAGGLPACKAALDVCTVNLATSNANLATCNGSLNICNGSLNTCNANESTCQADLTTCNANLTSCQSSSQTFPGDGYANPDAFGVSGHGPALSYTDNGDGTFTDNNTKLVWEEKTNVQGSVHFVSNVYNWSSSGTAPDGGLFTLFLSTLNNSCAGDETKFCTSDTDCTGIGNGKCGFAGHRDWCIPNVRQLNSIVDYSTSTNSSVPGANLGFSYWSVTTNALFPNDAWFVSLASGAEVFGDKKNALAARAVRPCP